MSTLPEIAWDGDGKWCGDGAEPAGGCPQLVVEHTTACRSPECGTFVCAWCRRAAPWCFGAGGDDGLDGRLCDGCWCELHASEDEAAPTSHGAAATAIALCLLVLGGCSNQVDEAREDLAYIQAATAEQRAAYDRVAAQVEAANKTAAEARGALQAAEQDIEANCAALQLHILKLQVRQAHRWSLNPMKHVKDAINASEFEIPVDHDFYAAVHVGQELSNEFRVGSAVLRGSISSMVVTVLAKRVELKGGAR